MNVFNGSVVKALRKARNLKQREVAAALGISAVLVCRLESGNRGKRIAPRHLVSLSELFQVPVSAFMAEPAETP